MGLSMARRDAAPRADGIQSTLSNFEQPKEKPEG
jgi:hypothetical protein